MNPSVLAVANKVKMATERRPNGEAGGRAFARRWGLWRGNLRPSWYSVSHKWELRWSTELCLRKLPSKPGITLCMV